MIREVITLCRKRLQQILIALLMHVLIYWLFKMALPDLKDVFISYNPNALLSLLFTFSSFVFWMHSFIISDKILSFTTTEPNEVFPGINLSLWLIIIILIRVLVFVITAETESYNIWQEPKYLAIFWGDYGFLELLIKKIAKAD